MPTNLVEKTENTIPLVAIAAAGLDEWLGRQPEAARRWLELHRFKAAAGSLVALPKADGSMEGMVAGLGEKADLWAFAAIAEKAPASVFHLEGVFGTDFVPNQAAIGWGLAGYRFRRYRADADAPEPARLVWPDDCDRDLVASSLAATTLVRDLINTPAEDLGPEELAKAAQLVAGRHGAQFRVIEGDGLIKENFPAVHAIGRAASRAPRLIDFRWGAEDAPRVTIVGKGVCFDSGGLDIKPASGMRLMKKDMGGAAHALGLAAMIMDAGLDLRLRVLIPAVENSVSANAIRPGDVVTTRKGLSIEIANTDAEGRVIMADALCEAAAENPVLLLDFATLTGAARVALGTELPALFSNDDALATDLARHGGATNDPLWRLPLWKGYAKQLESSVADLNNAPDSPYAGAITAALFLERFVEPVKSWAHFDLMAWNTSTKPGRPEGGEAMALRAVFSLLAERFPG